MIGYEPGKGKHAGSVGSLRCVMESGKVCMLASYAICEELFIDELLQKFSVGSGLSDRQRQHPLKVGSIIVYRFQELTKDGCPRLVSLLPYPMC